MPATQRYCAGDFVTWDPKITTFPGLYVLGAAYAAASATLLRVAGVTMVRPLALLYSALQLPPCVIDAGCCAS